jgi:hypothetical protein
VGGGATPSPGDFELTPASLDIHCLDNFVDQNDMIVLVERDRVTFLSHIGKMMSSSHKVNSL